LTASQVIAESSGGQHTLWMLTNLLARQFAVIHELEITVPPVPLVPGVALFGAEGDLPSTLVQTATLVAGTALLVRRANRAETFCDVEVMVGRVQPGPAAAHTAALGSEWRVFAGSPLGVPSLIPVGRNPLGPYFAACLAAGETFKRLRGLREGKGCYLEAFSLSLWDCVSAASWEELPDGEWPVPFPVPPCYLIGNGAVAQGLAAALTASGEVRGTVTAVDKEFIDDQNLNRYPLATQPDVGAYKSELTAARMRSGGLEVVAYRRHWPDYAWDQDRPAQRKEVREKESTYRYPLILSCVDRNDARHAIQKFWPEYLIGGSTSGLALEVTAYDMRSPYECLMCFNPVESGRRTIEEIAAELRQLPREERRARAEACGADWAALEEYLADPRCGHLGAAEIAKFRDEGVEWSVGFVSVASGTLLAAQFLKYALLGSKAFPLERGNSIRFNFLKPAARWTKHLRRNGCACASEGRADYKQLWG
jgi:molybdopterin/thiamine biosynthesis adenylyltransferase